MSIIRLNSGSSAGPLIMMSSTWTLGLPRTCHVSATAPTQLLCVSGDWCVRQSVVSSSRRFGALRSSGTGSAASSPGGTSSNVAMKKFIFDVSFLNGDKVVSCGHKQRFLPRHDATGALVRTSDPKTGSWQPMVTKGAFGLPHSACAPIPSAPWSLTCS